MRELMREYIQRRRQAREYDDYLRLKVEAGRRDFAEGRHFSNEEVEARAVARRAELQRRIGEGDL
jgi:predicted transcriptional regulator